MGNRDIFKLVFDELKQIWSRAAIPLKTDKKCLDQMISLHAKWKVVNKNSVEERLSSQCLLQVEELQSLLCQLCGLSPSDVYERLKANSNPKWEEDWDFLVGQRKVPQVGIMGRLDSVSVQRENKREMSTQNTPLSAKRTRLNEETPSETIEFPSESSKLRFQLTRNFAMNIGLGQQTKTFICTT